MLQYLATMLFVHGSLASGLDVKASWSNVDYCFPFPVTREKLINSGQFTPSNVTTMDVDVYNYGPFDQIRIFVTTPRLKSGTPATLSVLGPNGKLTPFPSFDWNSESSDCSKLINVLRIRVDNQKRLWVVDDGKINTFDDFPTFVCPPKIVIFNLKDNKAIGSYEVPSDLFNETSLLGNIDVDSRDRDNSFAFISDITSGKLIVFNLKEKSFWQWSNSALESVSPYDEYKVNGVNFTLEDGVLALAYYSNNDLLYFNSFSSVTQHSVAGKFLRNGEKLIAEQESFITNYSGERVGQATTHALTDDGILFFSPVNENSIRCWDVSTPYTLENQPIVAQDGELLQFVTGMKVRYGRFWAVSTRLQNFINDSVPSDETNYRILTQTVKKLVEGTKCDKSSTYKASKGHLFNKVQPSLQIFKRC